MRSFLVALVLLSALPLSLAAHADALGPFTSAGPGTNSTSVNADGSVNILNFNETGTDVYNGVSFTFTAVATTTGLQAFSYDATGSSAFFLAYSSLQAFDDSGTQTLYSSSTSGPFDFMGSGSLNLVAGDPYGFVVSGGNYDSEDFVFGAVTITSSPAVSVTPEPSSLILLGSGLLGLAGVARRRLSRS